MAAVYHKSIVAMLIQKTSARNVPLIVIKTTFVVSTLHTGTEAAAAQNSLFV